MWRNKIKKSKKNIIYIKKNNNFDILFLKKRK